MKKNKLDDLYREKFKDFNEHPGNHVWERIADSLDKRRKKRVIPIWWKLGGVAALLAVVLYIALPSANNGNLPEQRVVDTENKTDVPQTTPSVGTQNDRDTQIDGANTSGTPDGTVIVDRDSQNTPATEARPGAKDSADKLRSTSPAEATQLAASEKRPSTEDRQQRYMTTEQDDLNPPVVDTEAVAVNNPVQEKNPNQDKDKKEVLPLDKNEDAVAQEEEENVKKKSIYEAIEEQQALENAVAEATPKNKWSMGPAVAPVYFNSLGEGSPIHSNFASNSKSGKVNLSYGLQVNYNLTERLSIRSGIHKVDFGYDTNDIVFTSSLTTSTNEIIDNITYAQTSRNLVVQSRSNPEAATFDSTSEVVTGGIAPLEGRMVQQLGYLEVPMELNYAVIDKRLGVNIIGGISSLFLVDNAVSLESDALVTEMGQANNVNSLNFSTNIGVGVNYEISPKLQLNVEPIFKYQLNTFSETAGNFRPYTVGVYSGLNFRF